MGSFFTLSKVGGFLLAPSNLLILLLVAAIMLTRFQRTVRFGRRLGFVSATALIVASVLPVGDAMLKPLEQRFPPYGTCSGPHAEGIAGILLLGGSLRTTTTNGETQDDLSESADRIRLAAALARTHPDAPLLVSGGRAFQRTGSRSEAEATAGMLTELGVSPGRLILETGSRTTAENATLSAELAGDADGRWLLVTSAFHMPRAVGTLRAAGLDVIAAPTDWQVDEHEGPFSDNVSDRLKKLDLATKEYLGLLAYWLTGRTDALFPAPNTGDVCS